MKKVLLSSFIILSACLIQNGICSLTLQEDDKDTISLEKISSKIEEIKISEDELSLIIETVNKVQTFLGEQKENLKNFNKLQKNDFQEMALGSHTILMEELRNDPLYFAKDVQKRKEILKKDPNGIIDKIGEPLYKETLSGLNLVNHILNSFAK